MRSTYALSLDLLSLLGEYGHDIPSWSWIHVCNKLVSIDTETLIDYEYGEALGIVE